MKITDILSSNLVVPELRSRDKTELLAEMAGHIAAQHPEINRDALTAVLAERERLGSTAIGDGIAIPHGKIAGVDRIIGLFGRHAEGVDFDSLDGRPTHIFFVLVAPEDSASLHLKALARVSRLLKDPGFRERLIKAADDAEIFNLLKDEDARH